MTLLAHPPSPPIEPIPAPPGRPAAQVPFAPTAPLDMEHPAVFGMLLTAVAGFLDVVAYLTFSHLYVSFMSGNSIHLGMSVATLRMSDILAISSVVIAFVLGASAGTLLQDHAREPLLPLTLAIEAGLLLLAAAASSVTLSTISLLPVAIAMGLQNVLHQVSGTTSVGKGFVSGALVRLGQSIARLRSPAADSAGTATLFAGWIAFVAGAAGGALAIARLGFVPCLLLAASALIALLIADLSRR
ncbi:YoaK family protein [Xanthobacter flavus]|uniref:YoaK family protein n=1 Tax=Xanthobacter flavus TaxID=281 RepID=UPI00372B928F